METRAFLGTCAASLLLAAGPAFAQDFEAVHSVSCQSGEQAEAASSHLVVEDFGSYSEYMDKMYSSDAYAKFTARLSGSRKVVGINMYRRVTSWGD